MGDITMTAGEFRLRYNIGRAAFEQRIRTGLVKVVPGSIPMQVYDPTWGSAVRAEDIPGFECREFEEVLGLSSHGFRRMADRAKIPFHRTGGRRLYTIAALHQAIAAREKTANGRLNSGIRPWLLQWGKHRLGLPWKPVGLLPSPVPRIFSPFEVQARYLMSQKTLNRLIRNRRLLRVKGVRRLRIHDPEWTSAVGLTVHSLEAVSFLRCGEVAVLLGITPRMVRILAGQRKIRFQLIGKRPYFSLTAVREVLGARERGEQGRRKRGAQQRALLLWAQAQLRTPNLPGSEPSRAA